MQFLFSLLRIKVLYMFRALLAHLQKALHKRRFVYCVLVMSVGRTRIGVERCFYYTDILRCTFNKTLQFSHVCVYKLCRHHTITRGDVHLTRFTCHVLVKYPVWAQSAVWPTAPNYAVLILHIMKNTFCSSSSVRVIHGNRIKALSPRWTCYNLWILIRCR
jgi:hypothetical protein